MRINPESRVAVSAAHPIGFGRRGLLAAAVLWSFSVAVLHWYWQLDIATSLLFYDAIAGFSAAGNVWLHWFREFSQYLAYLIGVSVLLLVLYHLSSRARWQGLPRYAVALSGYFAVVVVVETLLKVWFGRARPYEVIDFGGVDKFSPVLTVADACATNCSFPSGEAAGAAAAIGLIYLVAPRWHGRLWFAVVVWTIMVSGLRVAFGRHFLSDVMTSWLVVYVSIWLTAHLMYRAGGLFRRASSRAGC